MTFLEAAIELLRQAGKPMSAKELAERAVKQGLLTHVGRAPDATMQARLAQELKKASSPLVRASGAFGLKSYERPRGAPAPVAAPAAAADRPATAGAREAAGGAAEASGESGEAGKKRRRRRRGRGRGAEAGAEGEAAAAPAPAEPEAEAPEAGTPEEAIAAAKLAEEAEAEAPTAAAESRPEIDLDSMLAPVPRRRGMVELPSEEALAVEYGEELTGESVTAPVEGEHVDEHTADEDRPMLDEIQGDRGDRDRRGRRRGRERGRGHERERGRGRGREREGKAARSTPPPQSAAAARPAARAAPERPAPERPAAALSPPTIVGAEQAPNRAVSPPPVGMPSAAQPAQPLAEVAYQLLRSLGDPRPVHARQLAAMALKRRLATGDPEETWRAFKAALLDDARARQARGFRARVRHHGGGLFALATSRLEPELASSEEQLVARAESLADATRLALRRRLSKLPLGALEQLARVYLDRAGWRDVERVKRVEATAYLSARTRRGALSTRVLVAVRAGNDEVGRRSVGELRAGVIAKQVDEGILFAVTRVGGDAEREVRAPGPAIIAYDGDAFAEELIRAGVGVVRAALPVAYLDADFLAELVEG